MSAAVVMGSGGVDAGNDARCPEVGLISTWKTGSIGLEILVRQASKRAG